MEKNVCLECKSTINTKKDDLKCFADGGCTHSCGLDHNLCSKHEKTCKHGIICLVHKKIVPEFD